MTGGRGGVVPVVGSLVLRPVGTGTGTGSVVRRATGRAVIRGVTVRISDTVTVGVLTAETACPASEPDAVT